MARSPEEELEQQLQMEAAGQLFGFLTLSVQQYQRHRIATPHRNSREICLYHLVLNKQKSGDRTHREESVQNQASVDH